MAKPTHFSVTEEPCTCDYLQDQADTPSSPIVFDVESAEYQYVSGDGMLVIYHCPFCGGAAPESKRNLLFAQIPEVEEERLAKLLYGIETIEEVLEKLGKPDFEDVSTTKKPERDHEAPQIQHHRNIRYHNLSDVAEVCIEERPDGKIFWQLQGKYRSRNSDGPIPNAESGDK
jgi:hypothetical protein